MTTELMTREQYVAKMADEWREEGAIAKEYRILFGMTIAEVANGIGVSASTIGRYERGLPVQSARLLGSAYFLFLEKRRMLTEPTDTPHDKFLKADFLIDWDGERQVIKKREYREVAEINTGDIALDQELAKSFCEKAGGSYYFVY
ncbi:helix-turn-helix domain-containing protein [Paenibacillus apii]|uniref:helix-turn-helix domain-containing protein n=1 Tax=Paenibacillus apii TaxID=1850370 RepID=UPI00143CA1D2|nr:helix-turn-helix transcriptional regulator [Paenibacillus apii]NJJ38404.1 helix-turn-helix transcriptional regulator [Paenibacillus apii]